MLAAMLAAVLMMMMALVATVCRGFEMTMVVVGRDGAA